MKVSRLKSVVFDLSYRDMQTEPTVTIATLQCVGAWRWVAVTVHGWSCS